MAAFAFALAAPNAVLFLDVNGVRQAFRTNRALLTDRLRALFAFELFVATFVARRWKEHRRLWTTTLCLLLPCDVLSRYQLEPPLIPTEESSEAVTCGTRGSLAQIRAACAWSV